MKKGEGRREAGSCQESTGAARVEEWLGAEEGALELNFLSPRWGWDLCCHLQGDAGCTAAGILMAWGMCGRGLRGHPEPLLGWVMGSEATPAAPTRVVSVLFAGGSPPGLAAGVMWRDQGHLAMPLAVCW